MPADPNVGTSPYLEGRSPEIEFLDCAKVFETGQNTCEPFNCYQNVLVIDEWSPLDPDGGHQRKYYAPGVGNIQIGAVGDPEGETLVLVEVAQLCSWARVKVNEEALKLDWRAYRISELYRHTLPAIYTLRRERCSG